MDMLRLLKAILYPPAVLGALLAVFWVLRNFPPLAGMALLILVVWIMISGVLYAMNGDW